MRLCLVAQSCLTLCSPMGCSPPGSSIHGILQARILERVAISYSRGSSQPRDRTCVSCISCISRRIFYHCGLKTQEWPARPLPLRICVWVKRAFPGGAEVKVSACSAGDLGSIPGSGRSPGEGNGNPLQYSCLENPMDGGAWWAIVHGVTESDMTERVA